MLPIISSQIDQYFSTDPLVGTSAIVTILVISIVLYIFRNKLLTAISKYIGIETPDSSFNFSRLNIPLAITFGVLVGVSSLQFFTLPNTVYKNLLSILLSALVLVWTRSVIQFGKLAIKKIIIRQYDEDLAPIIGNIWTISVLLSSLGLILSIWNVNITPLLASAGVIGIVAGFAARDTIANFFGSISLYADNTYKKGDFIELDQNEDIQGIVKNISIRSTQIQTLEGDVVTIPNSKLNNTIIRNKMQPNNNHRITIPFGVAYGTNPGKVKGIVNKLVDDIDRIQTHPHPHIHLRNFGDSAIHFELLCYIDHPRKRLFVEDEVYMKLYNRFEEEDITIPFPQRDVHISKNDIADREYSEEFSESNSQKNK